MKATASVMALTLVLVLACNGLSGEEKPTGKYINHELGLAINLPKSHGAETNHVVATLMLPPSNGFAPNINIIAQQYDGTIEDYLELSVAQFNQMKLQLVQAEVVEGKVLFEYSGSMNGSEKHWYAKGIRKNGSMYLATATALKEQWPDVGKSLMESIDSFGEDGEGEAE